MMKRIYKLLLVAVAAVKTLPNLKKVRNIEDGEEKEKLILQTTRNFGNVVIDKSNTTLIVEGLEHCYNIKTALFVSNHQSSYDIPLLFKLVPQQIGFVAKIELKKIPIINEWITTTSGVFMDRDNKRQSLQAIKEAAEKLKEGHNIVIFPEGTRSKGKKKHDFKTGSLTPAERANVPIIPVAIEGTYNILKKRKPVVAVTFLEPVYLQKGDKLNDLTRDMQLKIEQEVEKNKQYIKTIKK